MIISFSFWTARGPIGGRKIDPPEVLIVRVKLDSYFMEPVGLALNVDHRTGNLPICILVFEAERLGYDHRFLQCDESSTRIYNQRGSMFDEGRSVRVSA